MPESYQRECLHCKELFEPNIRNRWHQQFCSKPECRKASKIDSHRRWLSKPDNREHFRGSENVERVRQWREANPGYWKRAKKPKNSSSTLQDLVPAQAIEPQPVDSKTSPPPPPPLQDLFASQDPLLVGLISHMIDSPLQDLVEQTTLRLLAKGRTILDLRSGVKTNANHHEDQKTNPLSGAAPPHSRPVQLDRPTAGP